MRLPVSRVATLAVLIVLGGCATGAGSPSASLPPLSTKGPAADYPVVTGDPFTIDGVTHTPVDRLNYDAVGYASAGSDGGEAISAAHKTLPLPSYAEVTELETGKTILVRIERRGPMTNDRLVELSPGASAQLGIAGKAKAPVRLRRVNPPEAERALLRNGQLVPERMETPKALLNVLMRKLGQQEHLDTLAPVPAKPAPAPKGSQTAPAPAPAPAPALPPKTKPAPQPAAAKTTKPTASGAFLVQVAAFSTQERADKAAGALGGHVRQAGRFWRMQLGPFAGKAEADAALAKARTAGYSDARIQRAD